MGQRPTAVLFRDHFYGFRNLATYEPECSGDKVYWTDWDFALADAINFIKDHTNQHGHLVWEYEDRERVDVITEKKIDRHSASVEKKTGGKKYTPAKGEYWVSRLELYPGEDSWPTFEDYYAEQDKMLGLSGGDD